MFKLIKRYREYRLRKFCAKMARNSTADAAFEAQQIYNLIKRGNIDSY